MLKKLSLITLSTISAFAMHTAEININDKDLELKGKFDLGQVNDTVEPNTTFVGISYLNGDDDNADSNVNGYFEANFLMKREVKNSGITFGIGVKSNYTKINNSSINTIPLGLEVGYKIPFSIPSTINAKVYYAPQSLSFGEADEFLEYRLDFNVEVIERGSLVLGYRNIDINLKNSQNDITFNKSVYFGFRFAF